MREHADVAKNMQETGADGIMSAEGLLDNPAIFSPTMHGKDRLELALEYLDLVEQHPAPMRCVIFHTRRIAKQALMAYQLMHECCAATTVAEVRGVIEQCVKYQTDGNFVYDGLKVISQQLTVPMQFRSMALLADPQRRPCFARRCELARRSRRANTKRVSGNSTKAG